MWAAIPVAPLHVLSSPAVTPRRSRLEKSHAGRSCRLPRQLTRLLDEEGRGGHDRDVHRRQRYDLICETTTRSSSPPRPRSGSSCSKASWRRHRKTRRFSCRPQAASRSIPSRSSSAEPTTSRRRIWPAPRSSGHGAKRLYRRARAYGLRGLGGTAPRIPGASSGGHRLGPLLTETETRDVPLLYWTATAWGAEISLSKGDAELTADQGLVEALARRALALEEAFNAGAIHDFFHRLGGEVVPPSCRRIAPAGERAPGSGPRAFSGPTRRAPHFVRRFGSRRVPGARRVRGNAEEGARDRPRPRPPLSP